MTKITSTIDTATNKWIARATINGKTLATASGPADQIGERDCLIRLGEILADKLESVSKACTAEEAAYLPEVR